MPFVIPSRIHIVPSFVNVLFPSGAGSKQQKNKIKKGGNLKTLDVKPGLYTQYKPFLQKGENLDPFGQLGTPKQTITTPPISIAPKLCLILCTAERRSYPALMTSHRPLCPPPPPLPPQTGVSRRSCSAASRRSGRERYRALCCAATFWS